MQPQTYIGSKNLQKNLTRNRRKRQNYDDGLRGPVPSPTGLLPRRAQKICQPIPNPATRQSSSMKSGKVCNRVFNLDPENLATWDEVLSMGYKSKSLQSPVSSLVDSNTAAAVMAATTQKPVQLTSAGILEVPFCATATANNNASIRNCADGNRNKDDDDNNCRTRLQTITEEVAALPPPPSPPSLPAAIPAASAREFMTFERLRLGDQINFLLFDPYRTLKFLITELKSRLKTVVPDDINVQKILVEIQQTMKRIRIPNATEPWLPPPPRTSTTSSTTTTTTTTGPPGTVAAVECILPKERCHVIKEDPLINHARQVNSSCQTMEPQLENVNACQMCEHQVKQCAAGCNQKRMNRNTNAEDFMMKKMNGANQRSQDHKKVMDRDFLYKSLQDAIENLKIKSNPFSDDTQKIITQLETELSNFQHEFQRTPFVHQQPPPPPPTTENLKVQCKRLMDEAGEKAQHQPEEDEEATFLDFIAPLERTPSMEVKKLDSSTQVATATMSKESQTNLKRSTQMLCELDKEKLLLLQQFRSSEMQNIEGDLNELHVFIKDQLDGIYQSITRENPNLKYHSNYDRRAYKTKKKIQRTMQGPEKTPTIQLPSSSSPPSSLTALTSSVLSSTEMRREVGVTSPGSSVSPGHYKKSSPTTNNDGNANNSKSMMKQHQQLKSSSSYLSAADPKESYNISDVDKANRVLGEKKSKDHHSYHCNQHHLFAHINCCAPVFADTPFCSGHVSAVDCEGCCCCPHIAMDDKVQTMMTADAARPSTHNDIKSTTKKISSATTTCHQHRQQCHQQKSAIAAVQKPAQLGTVPPYIAKQSVAASAAVAADQSPTNLTNAAIRSIMDNAYEYTATAVGHSGGTQRMHKHRPHSSEAHNSWQRVNPKNPTGCQLKKQICGDGYECRINNNNNNNNDNRSNYSQIHDCQKCRANSINPPFGGLCSTEMHGVGPDNAAVAAATAIAAASDDDVGDRDDGGAGGDGPIYCDEGNGAAAILGDFTCHTGQRNQAGKLHNSAAKAAFQTDLEEFKAFLDEIIPSTPRIK